MSFSNQVIDLLTHNKQLSTNEIHKNIGMSIGYVRTQLRLMENVGLIERVDDRLPVIYRLEHEHPAAKYAERITKARAQLMKPVGDKDDNPLLKLIKAQTKDEWPKIAESLTVLAEAIRQLEKDNMLFDTL